MKFPITDFFIKSHQICRKLRIWSHLLKKSVMKTSFLCSVICVKMSYKSFATTVDPRFSEPPGDRAI